MRILVLGGTAEAAALAERLAGNPRFHTTVSLAGRTRAPAPNPVAVRVGGFGGAEGLGTWLAAERIDAIVDATHPFAAQISANVVAAAGARALPLATIVRPPWEPQAGDRWIAAATADDAARALGAAPKRVFLTIGRLSLGAFAAAPQHTYFARTIDAPEGLVLPPRLTILRERGPFTLAQEIALLERERIDMLVSKNSGGGATYAKIDAARQLGLPVVMIARPAKASGHVVPDADAALRWLEMLAAGHETVHSPRGV